MRSILQTIESGGLFVEDENKFVFSNVLVGQQAKARFKISNVGKIACDVNIAIKPISNKVSSPTQPQPSVVHRSWGKSSWKPLLWSFYVLGNFLAPSTLLEVMGSFP